MNMRLVQKNTGAELNMPATGATNKATITEEKPTELYFP
jgi:hypothetical protein